MEDVFDYGMSLCTGRKVGTSLSLCILAVLREEVPLDEVVWIVTGTGARTREEFREVLVSYCKSYWKGEERKAFALAMRLWETGRIVQPRLTKGHLPVGIARKTCWFTM